MLLLHILLIILKILGILLLIVVGLLLLVILALLFVPVTYTVRGDKQQETWGISARISWLFGGVSASVWHRGQTGWELRVLGIPIRKLMRRLNVWKERRGAGKKAAPGEKRGAGKKAAPGEKRGAGEKAVSGSTEKENTWYSEPSGKTEVKTASMRQEQEKAGRPESLWRRLAAVLGNFLRRIRAFVIRLVQIPGKIVRRIRKMWLTFRSFCDKIRRWKEFLTRDTTKAAVKFLLGRGRALLVHILPRKVRGKVTVGFEDPAITGQLLAAAGVFYPLYRDNIQITPVFDRQVLEGDFLLKGRMFGAAFVWIAWKIYRNRDVRITWQGFRNKEA